MPNNLICRMFLIGYRGPTPEDKYFTHDDIKGLLSFYQTELGKKTIKVLPQIVQHSWKAGQLWGQSLAPLIQERLKKRFKEEGIDMSI